MYLSIVSDIGVAPENTIRCSKLHHDTWTSEWYPTCNM